VYFVIVSYWLGKRYHVVIKNQEDVMSYFLTFFFSFKCLCIGSPADKADLEIGDEILEVNGKSLDGATHTEVISHIHQVLPFFFIFFFVHFFLLGTGIGQSYSQRSIVARSSLVFIKKEMSF
jgi:hypothetical protein